MRTIRINKEGTTIIPAGTYVNLGGGLWQEIPSPLGTEDTPQGESLLPDQGESLLPDEQDQEP